MKHVKSILAVAAVAALGAPAAGFASEDADTFATDPLSFATVYAADGTIDHGKASPSERAFVDQLLASKATAGVLEMDTSRYTVPQTIRAGFSAPTTRLARFKGGRDGFRKITAQQTPRADGSRLEERGFAIEIATGELRKVSIDAARRLSADPRKGKPGLEYVYQTTVLPAGIPEGPQG